MCVRIGLRYIHIVEHPVTLLAIKIKAFQSAFRKWHMPTNLFSVLGHKRTHICSQVAHNNYQLGVPVYANFQKIISSINNYFIGGSLCDLQSLCINFDTHLIESRKENPQKLTQLSSRSHPRHLVGKRTAQKDTTTDTTSDSQANSDLPHRRPPASRICKLPVACHKRTISIRAATA